MVLNRHHFMDLMFIHLILSLAAITVKVPGEMPESCDSFLHTSNFKDDRDSSNSDLCIMVILLPSGIHGSSIDGKPPPMIQRWRSRGKCDCRESNRLQSDCSNQKLPWVHQLNSGNDGRLKLFLQGGSRANAHAVPPPWSRLSRRGLFPVNFWTSISCIQTFAICLSALHCYQDPAFHSAAPRKLPLHDRRSPTSYQLHCSPVACRLSAVGRT